MQLHPIDWIVIGLYGVVMFAIAGWAMRRVRDPGSFLLGKRKLGKWMMMAQAFAGGTNANHPTAVAAACYRDGFSGMWLSLVWMLLTPFLWMYPPVIRRLRIVTIADVMRLRFGATMAMIYKIVGSLLMPFSMAFGLKSASIVVDVMTGGTLVSFARDASLPVLQSLLSPGSASAWAGWIGEHASLIVIVVPTLVYTLMGGIIAAYATDVLQGLLIVVLSFLMIPFAVVRAGGFAELDARIDDRFTQLINNASGQSFGPWWLFWFAAGVLFAAATATGIGAAGARNEMSARLSVFGLVIKRFCTVGWGMIGVLAMALYAGTNMVGRADDVFAVASGDLLPVVLRGVMVASVLAAVMSSLDGSLIGFSAIITQNFYSEHFVRGASPRHYLLVARLVATLGAAIAFLIAATSVKDIVRYAMFIEPMGGLMGMSILVALLWRRATGIAAIASLCVMLPLFFIGQRWNVSDMTAVSVWQLVDGMDWLRERGWTPVAWGLAAIEWPIVNLPAAIGAIARGIEQLYLAIGADVRLPPDGKLPIEISNPLYLLPGLATLIVVSLFTRQHDPRDVRQFYARLETPLGEEHRLTAAGFADDDLVRLDAESVHVGDEDRDWSRRLLLPDLLRLPRLLWSGEARWSDYKWDWIGLAGSIAFVLLFLAGVRALGQLL